MIWKVKTHTNTCKYFLAILKKFYEILETLVKLQSNRHKRPRTNPCSHAHHCIVYTFRLLLARFGLFFFITAKLRFISLVHSTHTHTHTHSYAHSIYGRQSGKERKKPLHEHTLICKLTSFHIHAHLYAHMYANLNVKEKVFIRDSKQQTLQIHGESIRKQWRNSKYRCKPTWGRTRTHTHTPKNKHWKKERPQYCVLLR